MKVLTILFLFCGSICQGLVLETWCQSFARYPCVRVLILFLKPRFQVLVLVLRPSCQGLSLETQVSWSWSGDPGVKVLILVSR